MKRLLVFVVAALALQAFAQTGQNFATPAADLSGALRLLIRDDVREDIGLTPEQKQRVDALRKETTDGERQVFMKDPRGQSAASKEQLAALQKKFQDGIEAILTPAQISRLKEIDVQLQGNMAADNPGVAETLGLTDEQKGKIKELNEAHAADIRSILGRVREREISSSAGIKEMQARNDRLNEEVGKVLTAEQLVKLRELGGKTFKPAPPPPTKDGGG